MASQVGYALPHLATADLGAPRPLLTASGWPTRQLAASILLEALQEQVINCSKVVVAAVL